MIYEYTQATALTSDARIMAKVISLIIKNGSILNYGSLQSSINLFPRSSSYSMNFNNQEQQRLESLPPVPDDERAAEVTQAAIFSGVIATCIGINIFGGLLGLENNGFTNLILGVAITTVVVDNPTYGEVLYRQIAGALAKRIVNYAKEDDTAIQGADSGFIKFGSRVDLFLPLDTNIKVVLNQKVKGGESIIAEI